MPAALWYVCGDTPIGRALMEVAAATGYDARAGTGRRTWRWWPARGGARRCWRSRCRAPASTPIQLPPEPPVAAIDPVCGMTVAFRPADPERFLADDRARQ
jgi:hypothetical protein